MSQSKYRTLFTPDAVIRMVYRRTDGDIQERIVKVKRIHTMTSGATAIFAHCYLRDETRCFNLSNVLFAMVDDGTPLVYLTAPARVLPYTGPTDSASRLAGWN